MFWMVNKADEQIEWAGEQRKNRILMEFHWKRHAARGHVGSVIIIIIIEICYTFAYVNGSDVKISIRSILANRVAFVAVCCECGCYISHEISHENTTTTRFKLNAIQMKWNIHQIKVASLVSYDMFVLILVRLLFFLPSISLSLSVHRRLFPRHFAYKSIESLLMWFNDLLTNGTKLRTNQSTCLCMFLSFLASLSP